MWAISPSINMFHLHSVTAAWRRTDGGTHHPDRDCAKKIYIVENICLGLHVGFQGSFFTYRQTMSNMDSVLQIPNLTNSWHPNVQQAGFLDRLTLAFSVLCIITNWGQCLKVHLGNTTCSSTSPTQMGAASMTGLLILYALSPTSLWKWQPMPVSNLRGKHYL